MAWRWPGDKPLFEPMMVDLLMHICNTQPQWVNKKWKLFSIKLAFIWWHYDKHSDKSYLPQNIVIKLYIYYLKSDFCASTLTFISMCNFLCHLNIEYWVKYNTLVTISDCQDLSHFKVWSQNITLKQRSLSNISYLVGPCEIWIQF